MEYIQTEEKFNEIINSDDPVIVKFFADWCPDCKRMDMFIGDILEEFSNYKWYEVNSDELPGLKSELEILGHRGPPFFKRRDKRRLVKRVLDLNR